MYKFILEYKKFLETKLNLGELEKPSSIGKRGDVLVNKLKTGEEFKKSDGGKSKIVKMKKRGTWVEPVTAVDQITDDSGKYDSEKAHDYFIKAGTKSRYNKVFKDDEDEELELTKLFKSEEFGSTGPGRNTQKNESMQCIFLGVRIKNPSRYLEPERIKEYFKNFLEKNQKDQVVMLKSSLVLDESVLDDYLNKKDWVETFCAIPNALWPDSKSDKYDELNVAKYYLDSDMKYKIYHIAYKKSDSPFEILQKKYSQLAREGGFSDINFSKFCPADAILIEENTLKGFQWLINKTQSIEKLAERCNYFFDTRKLVPISLKMIRAGAQFRIITNNPKVVTKEGMVEKAEPPVFSISQFIITDGMRGIFSKIKTKTSWSYMGEGVSDRTIRIDSSDTNIVQNVDVEVEGSTSRHGKIALNHIIRLMKKGGLDTDLIKTATSLSRLEIEDLRQMVFDLVNEIKSVGSEILKVERGERGSEIQDNKNKLISRIQSLQIILSLIKTHKIESERIKSLSQIEREVSVNSVDQVITKILRFALSIETDFFVTPRYLRVI